MLEIRGHKYVIPDVLRLESAIIVQQGNQKPTNILKTHTKKIIPKYEKNRKKSYSQWKEQGT